MAIIGVTPVGKKEKRSALETFATLTDLGLGVAGLATGVGNLMAKNKELGILGAAVKTNPSLVQGPDPLRGQDPNAVPMLSSITKLR